jgi:hypothetical protein
MNVWTELQKISNDWCITHSGIVSFLLFIALCFWVVVLVVYLWKRPVFSSTQSNQPHRLSFHAYFLLIGLLALVFGPCIGFTTYVYPEGILKLLGATSVYDLSPYGLTLFEETIESTYILSFIGLLTVIMTAILVVQNLLQEARSGDQLTPRPLGVAPGEGSSAQPTPRPLGVAPGEGSSAQPTPRPLGVAPGEGSSAQPAPPFWEVALLSKSSDNKDAVRFEKEELDTGGCRELDPKKMYYFSPRAGGTRLVITTMYYSKKKRDKSALLKYDATKNAWTAKCSQSEDGTGVLFQLLTEKEQLTFTIPHVFSDGERFAIGQATFVLRNKRGAN